MIIYHPELSPKWRDYGILIPLSASRSQQVFDALLSRGHKLEKLSLNELPVLSKNDLLLAHDPQFIERLYSDEFFNEFAYCFEILDEKGNYVRYDPDQATKNLSSFMEEILLHVAGSYHAMNCSLLESNKNKFSFFLGGGMHHSRYDSGAGFCLINDIIVGIKKLQNEQKIKTCWVIDVDAHKGDGTAHITHEDSSILTLSLHMEKGWPLDFKDPEHPSKVPSTVDVLINSKNQNQYNDFLAKGLEQLYEMQGSYPDLVVVNNGSDPYEKDELPSTRFINLTKEQLMERDQLIYNFCKKHETPQTWLMSGGYGQYAHEIYTQFLDWVLSNQS